MFRVAFVCGFLILAMNAEAEFYTYSEWERASPTARAIYMAGAFDSLVTIATKEGIVSAVHYQTCMEGSHMTNTQLAENVRIFASTRPELHARAAVSALLAYLISVCGLPKKE